MKIFSGFIWLICKVCWLVMKVLGYCFACSGGAAWLAAIVTFITNGLQETKAIIMLFIFGVICLPLYGGCELLAEKLDDICDIYSISSRTYPSNITSGRTYPSNGYHSSIDSPKQERTFTQGGPTGCGIGGSFCGCGSGK